MAGNQIYDDAVSLSLPVPVGAVSGDPVVVGKMPGVLLTDRDAVTLEATVFMGGAFTLSVIGQNDAGNSAVAIGDALFYDGTNIDKKESGEFFGWALGAVNAGATTAIPVKIASAGDARTAGVIPARSIGKAELAGGFLKVALAAGTAAATDVAVAGIAVGDELVFVGAFATTAAIATLADRTSEYAIIAGNLDKAAGTDETNNQLVIIYLDLT